MWALRFWSAIFHPDDEKALMIRNEIHDRKQKWKDEPDEERIQGLNHIIDALKDIVLRKSNVKMSRPLTNLCWHEIGLDEFDENEGRGRLKYAAEFLNDLTAFGNDSDSDNGTDQREESNTDNE